MARTRKGNRGIRIKEVSYSLGLLTPKDNVIIYKCKKHYLSLDIKEGFYSVELINGILDFFKVA